MINALVRASMIIVFTILFENAAKMALIQDQDLVQTLLANQAHVLATCVIRQLFWYFRRRARLTKD